MANASGPSGGGYDYVQDSTTPPTNPKLGEEWYQPDTDDVRAYDGGEWVDVKISDHGQLSGVDPADHFSPGGGLSFSAGALELLLSGYLELNGNGDLAISAGSVGQDRLAFSTATQSELSTHTGNAEAHHPVPAVTADDLSNTTTYTKDYDDGTTTLVDISGTSGQAIAGTFEADDQTAVTVTIDGSAAQDLMGGYSPGSGQWIISVPPIQFSNSILVEVDNFSSGAITVEQ